MISLNEYVKNNCNIKTTALSLGLSAVGAAGLVCAFLWFSIVSFGEMSKHPTEYLRRDIEKTKLLLRKWKNNI